MLQPVSGGQFSLCPTLKKQDTTCELPYGDDPLQRAEVTLANSKDRALNPAACKEPNAATRMLEADFSPTPGALPGQPHLAEDFDEPTVLTQNV